MATKKSSTQAKRVMLHILFLLLLTSVMTGCVKKQSEQPASTASLPAKEVTATPTEGQTTSNGNGTYQEPAYKKQYENAIQENQRYIWEYTQEESKIKKPEPQVASSSGNSPVKLKSLDQLTERLKMANLDFYLPNYIPTGFKVEDIGIYYYMNYDSFDISKPPIKNELVEKGVTFKVYQLSEAYNRNVDNFYIRYKDSAGNSIEYRYGLDFSNGEKPKNENGQISKEDFLKLDKAYTVTRDGNVDFKVNCAMEPSAVFLSPPSSASGGYYNSPDYYRSVSLTIRGEGIPKEEVTKIAQSIYQVNDATTYDDMLPRVKTGITTKTTPVLPKYADNNEGIKYFSTIGDDQVGEYQLKVSDFSDGMTSVNITVFIGSEAIVMQDNINENAQIPFSIQQNQVGKRLKIALDTNSTELGKCVLQCQRSQN